jgi:hypothetical protein
VEPRFIDQEDSCIDAIVDLQRQEPTIEDIAPLNRYGSVSGAQDPDERAVTALPELLAGLEQLLPGVEWIRRLKRVKIKGES